MRKVLPWVLGAALVVGAGAVTTTIPGEDSLLDPLIVRGAAGAPVTSRSLVVTVQDAVFADRLDVPSAEWSAEGNWLLVTVDAAAAQTEKNAVIGLATLTVDGRQFLASERPSASLLQTRLHLGTDITGTLAFQLPSELRSGVGELQFTTFTAVPQLDDVIAVPIDLGDLDATARFALESPGWTS